MPHLAALHRPSVKDAEAPSLRDEDQPAPEPAAGAERTKAFLECVRLVVSAHEQEVQHLSVLRAENALLRKQLVLTGASGGHSEKSSPRPPIETVNLPGTPQLEDHLVQHDPVVEHDGFYSGPSTPYSRRNTNASLTVAEEDTKQAGQDRLSRVSSTHTHRHPGFKIHNTWELEVDTLAIAAQSSVHSHRTHPTIFSSYEMEAAGEIHGIRGYISYPSSPGRLVWDMIGAFLIFYDAFMIPLEAFSPPRTTILVFMEWFTLAYWTMNMPMACLVGYVRNGVTIMDPQKIFFNYLRTWFAVDIIVVLPDWIFTLAALGGEESSSSGSFKLLRTLRLVRMVRLLRLLKLRRILQSLGELIETEYGNILVNIFKMIMVLLVINHYIGCLWFLIGTSRNGDDTWVVVHKFDQEDWGYQYFTAFHWAITQFTPASMDVQPQNSIERSFTILVVVFALVCFSYIVGSITGSLAQLRSMQEDTYKQFWMMRRYLKQNQVTLALSGRIQRYLEHAWQSQRQTLNLKNSRLFSLLSEQLQSELQFEICLPFLRVHCLFCELSAVSGMTMRRIAWTAMQRKLLATDDHLFIPGESATHMYILVNGCMEYFKTDLNILDAKPPLKVEKEDFISEPILWTPHWVHLGALSAVVDTEVLMLDPKRFSDIVHRNPQALAAAVRYGRNYVRKLNSTDEGNLSDVTHTKKTETVPQRSWVRPMYLY